MAKRAGANGRRSSRGRTGRAAPPAVVPDKYDALTVYDPATRTVRRNGVVVAGNTVTQPAETLEEMPRVFRRGMLYECEEADEEHIAALAKLANESVDSIESKRIDWRTPPANCSSIVRPNRQRCWRCPRWDDVDKSRSPFD